MYTPFMPKYFKVLNKVWSQTLNAKFYIYNAVIVILPHCPPAPERPMHKRSAFHHRFYQLSACCAHSIFEQEHRLYHIYSRRGKHIFTSTIWILIGKALALTSCLVTPIIFHSSDLSKTHSKLYSRRQPWFFCKVIRVLNRHSFFFVFHGQREHTKGLLKPQKHCSQQLLKFWVQQVRLSSLRN